jgi:hypothetical protein
MLRPYWRRPDAGRMDRPQPVPMGALNEAHRQPGAPLAPEKCGRLTVPPAGRVGRWRPADLRWDCVLHKEDGLGRARECDAYDPRRWLERCGAKS